jgi:sterol desaturase/sphingolipid hydroxylase (fatty acid hydroxylase superfamily)
MNGVRVGKRIIGADAPVTVGWENIGRVEGGPVKQFVFTYFQPTVLFALLAFWYYAPNSIAVASTAIWIGIGLKALLLALEWVNPRYDSWRLTWKEFATDLFYVGLGYTVLRMADNYIGDGVMIEAIQGSFDWDKFAWFTGLPLLVQALLISMIFDFGQYWMHRGMHNWYPLWLTHAPHHYITQLNINKGAVGNPVELFLIGLGIGGFFDFLPRAFLIAGTLGLAVGTYQHINVRFNTPRWWRFLFNTRRTTKPLVAIMPAPGSSSTACSALASTVRRSCSAWKAGAGCRSARRWSTPLPRGIRRSSRSFCASANRQPPYRPSNRSLRLRLRRTSLGTSHVCLCSGRGKRFAFFRGTAGEIASEIAFHRPDLARGKLAAPRRAPVAGRGVRQARSLVPDKWNKLRDRWQYAHIQQA